MSTRVLTTDYKQFLRETLLANDDLVKATFSGQHRNEAAPWVKVVIRPVLVRGQRQNQFSYFDARKDISKNYRGEEYAQQLEQLLALEFKHVHVQTTQQMLDITLTAQGKVVLHTAPAGGATQKMQLTHDHQKHVLLSAEEAAPFLKAVGIMTADGRIKADMQSKFRQINEFLKRVAEVGALEKSAQRPLRVVDCGCGNAYLTFAFYYYLHHILHIPTELTGIDVNGELLARHAQKSADLDWSGLSFQATSIIDFHPTLPPEIVLALHACDTATDEALAQGIGWQSRLLICAPCCQHHLQAQLDRQPTPALWRPVERHNILKERMGDILTDAFRALILRIMGYQTDVVQFVSSEHTAKNLLIRAVKTTKAGDPAFVQEYKALKTFWQVTPYLEELLGERFAQLLAEQ
jgi:SAM-dependent methyltransferase